MYALARWVWNIARWVWLTLVVPVVVDLFKSALSAKKPEDIIPNSFLFGSDYRILTLSILGVLFVITLAARIVVAIGDRGKGGKALREYLRAVVNDNTGLSPTGIYQQSQALISINVPLDDNFIHLRAVADRPRYDIPQEQLRLLEQLRQRSDLTTEEREEQIQRLRGVWWQELSVSQKQEVHIEEVLQPLTAKNPVAVILGAPGSGKSTTMRWLALHMARASLSIHYHLPNGLSMRQIPILLQIGDYAKCFTDSDDQPVEQFLSDRWKKIHADLPTRLMDELAKGHCMLLFDGLDEVANDELRRRVAKAIQVFIARYTPEDPDAKHYNRFIVTSRIAGYEEGLFSSYTHYTLQELTDKQIEAFLTTWCPAVERHMARSAERGKELTAQQRAQADRAGEEQRDRLVETLKTNAGIRRLAVNPLMLTILALIQRSGKTLPHRRIDLYQVVTRTLLDNWNQGTGRETLVVNLAEQALSNLAYHLHSSDRLITEREVKEIVRRSMTKFYERPLDQRDDAIIDTFIETIRCTSGLFVESGQGLFSFMHRTFQEYFVAQYLLMPVELQVTPNELQQVAVRYCRSATWREPLLLAIAARSGQDKQATSRLIEAILDTNDSYDAFLHRHLLFAARSMVDCEAWSITAALQQRVAHQLFDLYGDSFDTGRYTALQKEIEEVALLWLRGQPQKGERTPLLEACYNALCNSNHPLWQEGAAHLLASIAPDLPGCPQSVLHALIPPLLQLAGLQDWYRHDLFCPGEIRSQLPQAAARPTSLRVEEYAFITLRLLDAAGPAGWLRTAWLKWNEEQPALLERLTQHSLELDYPLTPAAFPGESDDLNWDTQAKIYDKWQELARRNPRGLQVQLLQASDTARFPHAYLFRRMLDREAGASSPPSWLATWDSGLQEEMAGGRSVTYQACLTLRLLLCRGNEPQRQKIANELMAALVTQGQQTQALITISNLYLRDLRDLLNLLNLRYMRYMRYMLNLRDLLDLRDLRDLLNQDSIIDILCRILQQRAGGTPPSTVLLALYSVITSYDVFPPTIAQQVHMSIQAFERQAQPLSPEQRQLIDLILRRIGVSSPTAGPGTRFSSTQGAPDERAGWLYALGQQQERQLTKQEVQGILAACTDTGKLSEAKRQEVNEASTVQEMAWNLLSQPFNLAVDALSVVVQALDDDEAIVCAAAALLLQRSKKLPSDIRQAAAEKIMAILKDEQLSRRPLDPPDYRLWRLDDVLFETLQVLAE